MIGLTNAATNPTTNPTGGGILYNSLTVGALSNRASSSFTKTLAGNTSTTVNSQLMKYDELIATGEVTTTASTVTLNVPLATNTTSVRLDIQAMAKCTVAGTGTGHTAIGDVFSTRQTGSFKNVAGTVSQVGSLPTALDLDSDTSLSTSTLTITISSTNIVVTLTINQAGTATTLGTIDSTLFVQCLYN